MEEVWQVKPSQIALKSRNIMQEHIAALKSIGTHTNDPEIIDFSSGTLCAAPEDLLESFVRTVTDNRHNGYAPSVGFEDARAAILAHLDHPSLAPKDVILSSGSTACLDIAVTALAERGQNILAPRPCNPHYELLAAGLGVHVRHYELVAGTWHVNIDDLNRRIDGDTAALLLNNPHDPTGSVYSASHLRQIFEVARRHRLPVIFDEIYKDLLNDDARFVSAIEASDDVPVLVCGGISHSWMVPGWRVGWILIHDPLGDAFEDVRKALVSLSQRIIGCNTVVQGAIAKMATDNVQFRREFMRSCERNGKELSTRLADKYGCTLSVQESIYTFMKVDLGYYPQFANMVEFSKRLYRDYGVLTFPGELFGMEGYMRVALNHDSLIMDTAITKFEEFCQRYYHDGAEQNNFILS